MGYYEEINSSSVRCRKHHQCIWCGEEIPSGDYADHRVYKYDGDFHSDYMHKECTAGMHNSDKDDLIDFGFEPGMQLRGDVLYSREAKVWEDSRAQPTPAVKSEK